MAESEANIIADTSVCSQPTLTPGQQAVQIRADFTNCALPGSSLESSCIDASRNEPDASNCGFASNMVGLCQYCASGSANSTDTCCYNSQTQTRCTNVVLPTIVSSIALSTLTATATATTVVTPESDADRSKNNGLSRGAIAGIVVGSIAALLLLIALLFFLLLLCRRRRQHTTGHTVLNQPTPARQGTTMTQGTAKTVVPAGYEILPGGRIARMSALEGHSHTGDSPPRSEGPAVAGHVGGRRHADGSSSDEFGDSPESMARNGNLRPPPTTRRDGSLPGQSGPHGQARGANEASGTAVLGAVREGPDSEGDMSSPLDSSQQSEQLSSFKDYYSNEAIHVGDLVATLWAYQPRAPDEFRLERGDTLRVVGIWDDGWATGVLCAEGAEAAEAAGRAAQRDSGVSSSSRTVEARPAETGEVKAFPLVCVCLPRYWRRTLEADSSTEPAESAVGV
jgi:hypothetical protein